MRGVGELTAAIAYFPLSCLGQSRELMPLIVPRAKTVCQLGLLLVSRLSRVARRKQITAQARRRNPRKWEAMRS